MYLKTLTTVRNACLRLSNTAKILYHIETLAITNNNKMPLYIANIALCRFEKRKMCLSSLGPMLSLKKYMYYSAQVVKEGNDIYTIYDSL